MTDWIEQHYQEQREKGRLGQKGYNPDQPRVPAGNPRGGQWTAGTFSDFAQLSRDIRDSYPQPVRDAIAAQVRVHYADRNPGDHDVQMMLDVMSMGKEHFLRYGTKIGLENVEDLWDQYNREGNAVEASVRKQTAQLKDELAYKLRDRDARDAQTDKWDRYHATVGSTLEEAESRLHGEYGINIQRAVDAPEHLIHKQVSILLNLAASNPALATVMKEQVKYLRYEKRIDTAAAKWRDGSQSIVIPHAAGDFPVFADSFVHELGHAAENYVGGMSRLDELGFGEGRAASLYGAGNNASEDWAEWFVGAFAQTPGLRSWRSDKYDLARNLIESLGGTGH